MQNWQFNFGKKTLSLSWIFNIWNHLTLKLIPSNVLSKFPNENKNNFKTCTDLVGLPIIKYLRQNSINNQFCHSIFNISRKNKENTRSYQIGLFWKGSIYFLQRHRKKTQMSEWKIQRRWQHWRLPPPPLYNPSIHTHTHTRNTVIRTTIYAIPGPGERDCRAIRHFHIRGNWNTTRPKTRKFRRPATNLKWEWKWRSFLEIYYNIPSRKILYKQLIYTLKLFTRMCVMF